MKVKDEEVVELFFDVTRLNRRHSERVYGRVNPFRGQYRCLFILDDAGTINQKDLAALLSVRPASVSEILSKLEQKGFITRTPCAHDKRISYISLTDKGIEETKRIRKDRARAHSEMLTNLTEEEKEHMLIGLQKIKEFYVSKETGESKND